MSRRISRGLAGVAAAALASSLVPTLASATAHGSPGGDRPAAQGADAGAGTTAGAGTGTTAFHRTATYAVHQNLPADVPASSETVAEISAVSEDGNTLVYTDAPGKRIGFLDITDPARPEGQGSVALSTFGHADDQPTSVAVHRDHVLVVVDSSGGDFAAPSGRLDVVRMGDGRRVASIDLGGQPDSIAISKDGAYAAIAMENQRDEEARPVGGAKGDLPQAPAGFIQVVDLTGAPSSWAATPVSLTNPDGSALPALTSAGLDAPQDPEPEYVSINGDNVLAVTLQENNGVVLVDLPTRRVTSAFTAGTASVSGLDTKKDGRIDLSGSITDVPREPDAIGWIDDRYVATANEGDWKGGTRGWTVFDTTTGRPVWDAGASFADEVVRLGLHNEDRAGKKGPEPEGLTLGTFGGVRYAFVGSERSNVVLAYDMTDPLAPRYVQALPATNGPEGLLAIESRDLLAISSETDDAAAGVRAAVQLYERGPGEAAFPSIRSADVQGKPVGWTALGALAADVTRPGTVHAASDAALGVAQLYTVDVTRTPAVITDARAVTVGGAPATIDVEGLAARSDGGFWLAVEGAKGADNKVLRTNAAGEVVETVALPAEVTSKVGKWGLEGVTTTHDAEGEHLWVALQRPLWTDGASPTEPLEGENTVRLGRYDVADASWHWYGYRLESPRRDGGDWMGLSEIVAVDADTLAVIERDKLNGPRARVKRIYTVDVPAGDPTGLPVLRKELAYDVLPDLRATRGWTQEKLEGLTIAADGQVYAVTDNDGLKDATGETVFLRLGAARDVFARTLATTTTLEAPRTVRAGKALTVTASVSAGSGVPTTGTVTLRDGTRTLGTAQVKDGRAVFTVTDLPAGRRALRATYAGGPRSGESSATASVTVTKAPARLRITAPSTVKVGEPTRVTVRVHAPGLVPGGRVRITDGGKVLATVRLHQGSASAKVRLTGKRLHRVKVTYAGDARTKGASRTVRIRVR
ncbi:esterase-like activity of phytase family protein [Nocardioides daphniae]|uniref:Alkaline phosphatase n=1 Tax=Nocardioides daphniae TaxID=402297 RepID=A0A4P7UDB4_9ACTN|nr:esterase-like activity of phytase family protein [Nocardioides daphniae]QCC77531.1 alkaline phosphatase [Nocardioides daphniae]GGD31040.1 hypothetical protein GCM10007231_33210 [Nocardioides daphniae]